MQKPVLEYVRHGNEKPLLESVLIMSYEGISYDDTPYVCCGTTYSLGDVRVYHNCRAQYEDRYERDFKTYFVLKEACPRCSERSRKKRLRKVQATGGFTLWKYGQRIVSIAHNCCQRKFEIGQEVIANGRNYSQQNTKKKNITI